MLDVLKKETGDETTPQISIHVKCHKAENANI
jgi:hypothetical protein